MNQRTVHNKQTPFPSTAAALPLSPHELRLPSLSVLCDALSNESWGFQTTYSGSAQRVLGRSRKGEEGQLGLLLLLLGLLTQ